MNDEGLRFLYEFAKDKERTKDDAEKAYVLMATRASAVEGESNLTHFAWGAFFHAIVEQDLWKKMDGVEEGWTFATFCKEKVNMSIAKANQLRILWQRAQKLGVTEKEVQLIGWHAAGQIVKYCISHEEAESYIAKIQDGETRQEVLEQLHIKKNVAAKKATVKEMRFKVPVHYEKFFQENLELAAQSMQRKLGVNIDPTECLGLIMAQWREARGNGPVAEVDVGVQPGE